MYALQFLCALAIKGKQNPNKAVHLREIAEEYAIPFKFLEQIAILMKSVGLVNGARGKSGGYQLADIPENINLARILKSTEGQFIPCSDIEGGQNVINALIAHKMQECRELVENVLTSVTLADLAEKAKNKTESALMYYL